MNAIEDTCKRRVQVPWSQVLGSLRLMLAVGRLSMKSQASLRPSSSYAQDTQGLLITKKEGGGERSQSRGGGRGYLVRGDHVLEDGVSVLFKEGVARGIIHRKSGGRIRRYSRRLPGRRSASVASVASSLHLLLECVMCCCVCCVCYPPKSRTVPGRYLYPRPAPCSWKKPRPDSAKVAFLFYFFCPRARCRTDFDPTFSQQEED
jgi:hypothetical protein